MFFFFEDIHFSNFSIVFNVLFFLENVCMLLGVILYYFITSVCDIQCEFFYLSLLVYVELSYVSSLLIELVLRKNMFADVDQDEINDFEYQESQIFSYLLGNRDMIDNLKNIRIITDINKKT